MEHSFIRTNHDLKFELNPYSVHVGDRTVRCMEFVTRNASILKNFSKVEKRLPVTLTLRWKFYVYPPKVNYIKVGEDYMQDGIELQKVIEKEAFEYQGEVAASVVWKLELNRLIVVKPGNEIEVVIEYVQYKELNDTEVLWSLYPSEEFHITVTTHSNDICWAIDSLHKNRLIIEEKNDHRGVYKWVGTILPHQGIFMQWRHNFTTENLK
jgi:hypothetical protein